jgi:hypothetical protein
MLVTGKEKMCFGGMCKHEGKTPFGEYAKPSQAGLAEQGDGGLWGKVGQLERARPVPKEDFKMEIDSGISIDFRFWQDFEEFYEEI